MLENEIEGGRTGAEREEAVSDIATLATGAGGAFLGSLSGGGLKYLFELIVARNLGAQFFGVFWLGWSLFRILERVSLFPLGSTVVRYVAMYLGRDDRERAKGAVITCVSAACVIGIAIAALTIGVSDVLGRGIFHRERLSGVLRILSVGLAFSILSEVLLNTTQALNISRYRILVRNVVEPLLGLAFVFISFRLGYWLMGAAASVSAGILCGTLVSLYVFIVIVGPVFKGSIRPIYEVREMFRFSWPLLLMGFLGQMMVHANTLMLAYFRSSSEIGVYAAVERTALLVPLLLDSFNSIFSPMIADLYHRREMRMLERLFQTVTRWVVMVSFPLSLMLCAFPKELLSLWGKSYTIGCSGLIIIALAQLINASTGSVGYMLIMTGHTAISLVNSVVSLLLIVLSSVILIPRYGVIGAVVSVSMSLILLNMVRLVQVYILVGIQPFRRDLIKPLASGMIAMVPVLFARHYVNEAEGSFAMPALCIAAFAAMYCAALFSFGFGDEDKRVLRKVTTRLGLG